MEKDALHKLIERYLDAAASLEEERELRECLLNLEFPDEEQKAVLAVMGYAGVGPESSRKFPRKLLRYAAILGAIIMISAAVIFSFEQKKSSFGGDAMCIAYVRGVEINDEDEVMRLVSTQLAEMSQTSEEMRKDIVNDFEELSNALIEIEI